MGRAHRKFLPSRKAATSISKAPSPQTLAFALNDSPVGLCSWILENRRTWSDCDGQVERRFTKDDLLTTMMIYWATQSFGTSARYYYEAVHNPWQSQPRGRHAGRSADCRSVFPEGGHPDAAAMGGAQLQSAALDRTP